MKNVILKPVASLLKQSNRDDQPQQQPSQKIKNEQISRH